MLRLILIAVIAYAAFMALRIYAGLKRIRSRTQPQTPRQVRGTMVKDEVCGTYIAREDALIEVHEGVERYFCSEECRRKSGAR